MTTTTINITKFSVLYSDKQEWVHFPYKSELSLVFAFNQQCTALSVKWRSKYLVSIAPYIVVNILHCFNIEEMMAVQQFTSPGKNPLNVTAKYPSLSVKFADPEDGIAKFQVSLPNEAEYSTAMDLFAKVCCISSSQELSQRVQPFFGSQTNLSASLLNGFNRESLLGFEDCNRKITTEMGDESLDARTAEQLSEMDPSQLIKIISERLKLPHMKRLVSRFSLFY